MRSRVAFALSLSFAFAAPAARADEDAPPPASTEPRDAADPRARMGAPAAASPDDASPPQAPHARDEGAKIPPTARVHVVSRARVVVQRRDEDGTWRDVCSSPCDAELPAGDGLVYRVAGDRIVKPIAVRPPYVEVVVDPPSSVGKAFGGIGVGAGGVTALVGLTMIARGNKHADYDCNRPGPDYPDTYGECVADREGADELVRNGVIAMVAGAVVAGLGAWLFVASSRGSVTTVAARDSASGGPRRTPTWRSLSSAENALRGPAPIFPILLNGRF